MATEATVAERVLFTGDRNWKDEGVVRSILVLLQPRSVCHGAARGLDRITGRLCKAFRINCQEFPAQWETYGRAAGPIRNREMFDAFLPHIVVGFHDDIAQSKGTKDMIGYARQNGTYIYLVTHEPK